MKRMLLMAGCLFFISQFAEAQDTSAYSRHLFIKNHDTMPYRVLLPLNFNPSHKYPLILFLHGSGERGNDNNKQLVHGGSLFVADSVRQKYPAIVVFPQCSENSFWANITRQYDSNTQKTSFAFKPDGEPTEAMKLLLDLLRTIEDNYPVDKRRMYVGGLSMGGMGTFELVRRRPGTFAAAIPICGGADTSSAAQLSKTAWWIFHGLKDPVVNPQFSEDMAGALKACGADVKLTLYPEDGHNSWDDAFREPDLFKWLFAHRKK
jgi:predicted peptidase